MGIPFPKPFTLQIENIEAIAFADNSAFKSKLKHIDVRQEWVQTLRNHSIINPVYVPSEENLADLFTKILDAETFTRLRDRMMFKRSSIRGALSIMVIACDTPKEANAIICLYHQLQQQQQLVWTLIIAALRSDW